MISTNTNSTRGDAVLDHAIDVLLTKANSAMDSDPPPEENPLLSTDQPLYQVNLNSSDSQDKDEEERPLVIDVASIIEQGNQEKRDEQEKQATEMQNSKPSELSFQCSSCPKKFASKMQRLMHEKLHMQNRGNLHNKSRLKEKMTARDLAGHVSMLNSNNDSLLCGQCNVYFRTSTAKQEHICSQPAKEEGTKKQTLLKKFCCNCGKEFLCERPKIKKCLGCLRSGKRKFAGQQKASEEIREINGQKVKVIRVNNLEQLSGLKEPTAAIKPTEEVNNSKEHKRSPIPKVKIHLKELQKLKDLKRKRRLEEKELAAKKAHLDESNVVDITENPAGENGPKVKFACLYCDANFYFPATLKHHALASHNRFFYCKYCYLMFQNSQQKEIHRVECAKSKIDPKTKDSLKFMFNLTTRTCTKCEITFESDSRLLEHATSKHSNNVQSEKELNSSSHKTFIVPSMNCCGETFPTRSGLVLHKKSIHKALDEVTENSDILVPKDNARLELLSNTLAKMKIIKLKCPYCPMVNYSLQAEKDHRLYDHNIG